MASTNKTTNYDLSQYLGTDKPTYLGDYNSDMLKIDTGIKGAYDRGSAGVTAAATAQDAAETADGKATNAATAAAAAQATADYAATAASTADGKAVAAQTTANTANAATVVNANTIQALADFININTYLDLTVKSTSNATIAANNMKIARNNDGSLCKIYGRLLVTSPSSGTSTITLNVANSNTGLKPESDITIEPAAIFYNSKKTDNPTYSGLKIKTNGDIEISYNCDAGQSSRMIYIPFIIFVKDFGDQPE